MKNFQGYSTLFFFITILAIGFLSVDNYGTTNDEYTQAKQAM